MDETLRTNISNLVMALKAVDKSVEKLTYAPSQKGAPDLLVKQYKSLHQRAKALLPDDFYIQELLDLEIDGMADDETKLAQIRLVIDQLLDYLQSQLKAEPRVIVGHGSSPEEMKDLGREIQDQILNVTRKALKRAILQMDLVADQETIPPVPPVPPIPPMPPAQPPVPPEGSDE